MSAEVSGTVVRKVNKSDYTLYYLKQTVTNSAGGESFFSGRILVYADTDSISTGALVTVTGEISLFSHSVVEGQFDMADYYASQKITCYVFEDSMETLELPRFSMRETLYQIQKRISRVFEEELTAQDAGILSTLVLGNKGLLDDEIRDTYQDAGISHILAVSGLHLAVFGFGLYRLLRRCCVSYPVSAILSGVLVLCFAEMSGMGISARRALAMFVIRVAADVLGRAYDGPNALALSALLVLIPNPLLLTQSGFLFSFGAMAGILFLLPPFLGEEERPKKYHGEKEGFFKKMLRLLRAAGRKLRRNLVSGFLLQLVLIPLTAWFYYEVPVYALFLNLCVLPLSGYLLGFGLAGGLTGLFCPAFSKWLLVPCHFILVFYDRLIALSEKLPFAQVITGQPDARLLAFYYLDFAVLALCLNCLRKKTKTEATGGGDRLVAGVGAESILLSGIVRRIRSYTRTGRKTKCQKAIQTAGKTCIPASAAFSCICLILALVLVVFLPKRESFRVCFLDVGQGDGIYIADGAGNHLMIDGGSTSESEVGTYRLEPFLTYNGIRQIDAWIVTHADSDHCSGLLELLEDGYPVQFLLLAEAIPRDEAWEELITAAEENGTEVVYVSAGDSLNLEGCSMECLYPSADDSSEDANALSQVWSLQVEEISILFTGDIGSDEEELLLERGLLFDCTILKVAHHGSKYSTCEAFLETVQPEWAVISYGEGNSYGHPHADTLERLKAAGSEVVRTAECGQITLCKKKGEWVFLYYALEEGTG